TMPSGAGRDAEASAAGPDAAEPVCAESVATGSVVAGRDVVTGLDEPEGHLGGSVVGAGPGRLALARVGELGLAVGQDQGVLILVVERDDLPVERAAVESCECHVLTLVPRGRDDESACVVTRMR